VAQIADSTRSALTHGTTGNGADQFPGRNRTTADVNKWFYGAGDRGRKEPVERTAVQLAEDAARLGNPREGLAAITELRRRLEELEACHVENAVRAGLSWSQIGAALGVSKQAAHKKHSKSLHQSAKTSFATVAREQGIVVQHGAAVRALEAVAATPPAVRKELTEPSRRRGRNVRLGA
jgi:hypothetical protein